MAVDFTKGYGPLAVTMRVMDSKQNNVSFVLFFAKSHGYVLSNYKMEDYIRLVVLIYILTNAQTKYRCYPRS